MLPQLLDTLDPFVSRKGDATGGDNASLTLKQLVGVNDALLSTCRSFTATSVMGTISLDTNGGVISTEELVRQLLSDEEEISTCLPALLGNATHSSDDELGSSSEGGVRTIVSARALLTSQYLLHLARPSLDESSAVLGGINAVVLPLLLRPSYVGGDKDDDDCRRRCPLMDLPVRYAIIEAAFSTSASFGSSNKSVEPWGQTCIDMIARCANSCVDTVRVSLGKTEAPISPENSRLSPRLAVETAAQLLGQLRNYCLEMKFRQSNKNLAEIEQILLTAMHSVILDTAVTICSSPRASDRFPASGDLDLMRPLTGLLLPIVWGKNEESDEDERFRQKRGTELWDFLSKILLPPKKEDSIGKCDNWENVASMVATGILCCSSFHGIIVHQLPQIDGDEVSLALHPSLWNFIQSTLGRIGDSRGGAKGELGVANRGGRPSSASSDNNTSNDQILRRRAIHIMKTMVDHLEKMERDEETKELIRTWKKYVYCFEAVEMETEGHLVDQIWPTTTELCGACGKVPTSSTCLIPPLSWEWMGPLFARVLLSDSPNLAKLGLYRFLIGDAGVASFATISQMSAHDNTGQGKIGKGTRKKNVSGSRKRQPAQLSLVSPSFVINILFRSYDSILHSVGTSLHVDEKGKTTVEDVVPRLKSFIKDYITAIHAENPEFLGDFLAELLGEQCICTLRPRAITLAFVSVGSALQSSSDIRLPFPRDDVIKAAVDCLNREFASGGFFPTIRQSVLKNFALILSRTSASSGKVAPALVLSVLNLFPSPLLIESEPGEKLSQREIGQKMMANMLCSWILNIGDTLGVWAAEAGSACASMYVHGELLPFEEQTAGNRIHMGKEEKKMGSAIVKLCALAGSHANSPATSGMLWPAINRGLSQANFFNMSEPQLPIPQKAKAQVSRALTLLEHGCIQKVINGMGHGELVMDKRGSMLPPPPEIESQISSAVRVILSQIQPNTVTLTAESLPFIADELRSGTARWCGSLKNISKAFPSSVVMEQTANKLLEESLESLQASQDDASTEGIAKKAKAITLLYASLACGGEYDSNEATNSIIETCQRVLKCTLTASNGDDESSKHVDAVRDLFLYSKWSSLAYLVPMTFSDGRDNSIALHNFHEQVLTTAMESLRVDLVQIPQIFITNTLQPLFETVLSAAKLSVELIRRNEGLKEGVGLSSYSGHIHKIVVSLLAIVSQTPKRSYPTKMFMVNAICSLLFRPSLVMNEYKDNLEVESSLNDQDDTNRPIRSAFRNFVKMAGTNRPHIIKTAIASISSAWLGPSEGEGEVAWHGLGAIPFRQDIVDLVAFKEDRISESASYQGRSISLVNEGVDDIIGAGDILHVPSNTDELSVVRGFLLVFFSKLPDPGKGLNERVLKDLLHYAILRVLDSMCDTEKGSWAGHPPMTGSFEYCRIIRSWQALCLLARFVTDEIAEEVCDRVYLIMSRNLHGQIRYFIEMFSIMCHRAHQKLFLDRYLTEVQRYDLTLQQVSSLMIIGGNIIVGRYSDEFFKCFQDEEATNLIFHKVLAGTLPWLSSTQGFARAIAQLLVHKLATYVIDVNKVDAKAGDDGWYLQTIYNFLDKNPEMIRIRKKQMKFFHRYDTDVVCTPESVLSFPVDVGNEADPPHMIRLIKKCLEEAYEEAQENNPDWKQAKGLIGHAEAAVADDNAQGDDSALVDFQRKIVPFDSLNLALEETLKRNQKNAAGRARQDLIICASLIDKVPNLGGLTRTAEIFAANRLVIPDKKVVKMDNFKTISAAANDWVTIEECKEEDLLDWLKQRKDEGYEIVALEQTSSSSCLSKYQFRKKSVLLLGKEKEGVPVEFLQSVDTCLEVPQLGITRSLNVHVTGAIAIWEYTKQGLEHKLII